MVDNALWRRLNRRNAARSYSKQGAKTRSMGELEQGPFTGEIMRPTKDRVVSTMGGGYKYQGKSYPTKKSLPKDVQSTARGHNTKASRGTDSQRGSSTAAVAGGGVIAADQANLDRSRANQARAAASPKRPKSGSIDAVAQSLVVPKGRSSPSPARAKTTPKSETKRAKASSTTPSRKPFKGRTPKSNPERTAIGTSKQPIPKTSPKPKPQSNYDKQAFGSAFSSARKSGLKEFTWRGKRYTTKVA